MIERTIAPISAAKKESITKPDTSWEVIQSIKPLTNKVKRPKVRIFIGRVINNIIGRMTIFTAPRIKAAQSADENEVRCIPTIMFEVIISARALTRSLIISDIS